MSNTQGLGEFKSVENKGKDGTEASTLLVGWLKIDGDLKQLAFTQNDLKRPLKRAERNKEDLPTLEADTLTNAEIDVLKDELERLKSRSFWARLFNK